MAVVFFETLKIELAAGVPENLSLRSFAQPADLPIIGWVFLQNTGTATLQWRESPAAPAETDTAHPLASGEGLVALVLEDLPFWLWGSGELTVSPAAPMPTREA